MNDPAPPAYLVFGDLHGRVLPAFRLAIAWSRDHGRRLDGLLQIGDLGYFPDLTKLDKATIRHAADDPLELGVQDIVVPNAFAESVFDDPNCPPALWFTAGNHEDFDELERYAAASGRQADCVVDAYCMVRAIKDGRVAELAGRLKTAAIWGVDGASANRRTNLPRRGYISERAVDRLLPERFDVLLSHDAPLDAKRVGYGSEVLANLIQLSQPQFAFFGHYKGDGERVERDYGRTAVYHMAGFELRERDGTPEPGSVGLLRGANGEWQFEYLPREWLKTFTRYNWKWR